MEREEGVLLPINRIAEKLGLSDNDLEFYGRYTAKIRLSRLPEPGAPPRGKLLLVTAMTPTSHGEGKTVVSIGLAQAMEKLGKKAIVTLREPSLGPVFGVKGGATGAMMVLLNEAIMPNLVQTTEHTPALIHAGPFANIAHGTSSVIAQRMALDLADYVINETGFGADLGLEKFLDIVMPASGLMMLMPGLSKTPQAVRMNVDRDGRITGLS